MKKLLGMILCLCMVIGIVSLVSVSAQEAIVEKLTFTAPIPVINQLPNTDISAITLVETGEVEIIEVKCPTVWGVDYFMEDQWYSYKITIRVKDGVDKLLKTDTVVTVNDLESCLSNFSKDYKEATVFMKRGMQPVPASSSPGSSSVKQPVVSLIINIDAPVAWKSPSKEVTVDQPDLFEVVDVKWNGTRWHPGNTFMESTYYDADVTLRLKSGVNMYFDSKTYGIKAPGGYVTLKVLSDDKSRVVYNISFDLTPTQKEVEDEKKADEEAAKRKGTPVSDFEPGDSGSVYLMGAARYYSQPKDDGSLHLGGFSTSDGAILEVIEAYVPSINRENEFYHVVKGSGSESVIYVEANPKKGTFSDYYKTGNNPDRPYATKWASKIKIGDPISEMGTWMLKFENGKVSYNFIDSYDDKYGKFYLDKIEYDVQGEVKPFSYVSAVATFKAKEGYYFDKGFKINEYEITAEHTVGFKVLDDKTVEVYLTGFTGSMGHDVRISDAMKEYKKKVNEMNLTSIATAQVNFPLYDYWYLKFQRGDYEHNAFYVTKFYEANMRTFYAYPTTEQYVDTNGKMVYDGGKKNYTSEYTIISVDILDDDLSDDIPGLVGEWCLVDNNMFVPKACLKDIQYGAKFAGAPATMVNSPFEFAGGSGTQEDPYLVQTAEQLNAVRKGPRYHYKLIADIDLSSWGNWVPIGGTPAYGYPGGGWDKAEEGSYAFLGSFDGNGHVVSGMQIIINEETPFMTESGRRAYGLFASLATNPVEYKIKNLGVVNFNIDVNYTNVKKSLELHAAAIIGGMNNGTDIVNCYSQGGRININVKGNEAYAPFDNFGSRPDGAPTINVIVGGICSTGGGVFGGGPGARKELMHIEKCFNDSSITVDVQNADFNIEVGGIIGSMDTTHIQECYNKGNITLPLGLDNIVGDWKTSIGAGICAYASIPEIPGIYHTPVEGSSFIQNCYNAGQITARGAAGIFNFSVSDIYLENCYNAGTIIGNELDHSNDMSTINPIISEASSVTRYGSEFIKNCYTNGNSISGSAWKSSSALGRKVLVAIPEDNQPSIAYSFVAGIVGNFADVKQDAWYGKAVQWAVDKNITSGTSATTFSPDDTCTRAQILTFLWRAVGSPKASGANPFSDVKATDYYYDAAIWASGKGIISGTVFAGNTPCTRAETVIYLWKNAGCPYAEQANQFLDIADIHSELGKAVSWAFINAITGGTSAYTFSPNDTCTRGQIVTFLQRAFK